MPICAPRCENPAAPARVSFSLIVSFPVSASIEDNARHVLRQMDAASRRGARVAHFPEGSLSGYAGTDFETIIERSRPQVT